MCILLLLAVPGIERAKLALEVLFITHVALSGVPSWPAVAAPCTVIDWHRQKDRCTENCVLFCVCEL